MVDRYEWANRVGYHPASTKEVKDKHELFRELVFRLGLEILAHTNYSREQSLAITNLEDALMWTNKAIAIHESPMSNEWEQKAGTFNSSIQ